MYKKVIYGLILVFFVFVPSRPLQALRFNQIADEWEWPLGGDGFAYAIAQNSRYGTTLENTDYQVRNLDLVHRGDIPGDDHINCFSTGQHRQWHAGIDLYRVGGNTAGATVKAVANGVVYYAADLSYPGSVVIIEHTLPKGSKIYSVYAHLLPASVSVTPGQSVDLGDPLGTVLLNTHSGRYPEFHPDGDDSHLHFEIRTFADGTNLFPGSHPCNLFVPAIGYTYPDIPDTYGYLDPIEFISDHMPVSSPSSQIFLPLLKLDDTCVEGQDLITSFRNGGFEYPIYNPAPWLEITTYFDPPDMVYYRMVEDNPFYAYSGNHSALFGNQLPGFGHAVDEQMIQSVGVPSGVMQLEWVQYIRLERTGGNAGNQGTEFGDKFVLSMQDAVTGVSLRDDIVVDHLSPVPNYSWLKMTIYGYGIDNQAIGLSYSSFSDGDAIASTLRVDQVQLITRCGQQEQGLNQPEVVIEPVSHP